MLLRTHTYRSAYQYQKPCAKHSRQQMKRLSKHSVNHMEQLTQNVHAAQDSLPLTVSIKPVPHHTVGQINVHRTLAHRALSTEVQLKHLIHQRKSQTPNIPA